MVVAGLLKSALLSDEDDDVGKPTTPVGPTALDATGPIAPHCNNVTIVPSGAPALSRTRVAPPSAACESHVVGSAAAESIDTPRPALTRTATIMSKPRVAQVACIGEKTGAPAAATLCIFPLRSKTALKVRPIASITTRIAALIDSDPPHAIGATLEEVTSEASSTRRPAMALANEAETREGSTENEVRRGGGS